MIDLIIQKIDFLLKKANFETFTLELSKKKNKFCYDLLVKKKQTNLVFLVKVFTNIDNLNESIINNIKALSFLLKSKPLLIGIKNRYQKLDDNTIYIREELPFITFNTIKNILNKNVYPHILAKRGGGVTFLDGDLMKTLREQKNISRKEMSDKLEVTKRTICAYENEKMRPSEKIAKKILNLLENESLFKKINVFKWNIKIDINQKEFFEGHDLNSFEYHLKDIIEDIGLSSYWYQKGQVPFKLTLFSSIDDLGESDFYPLISGVSDDNSRISEFDLKCFLMFTKFFHKKALFIVNNIKIPEILKKNNIPLIKIKSLEKIDNEKEFIEFIQSFKN